MATPVYITPPGYRSCGGGYDAYGEGYRSPGAVRTWGVVTGQGSMLGDNTPRYFGAGQPAPDDAGGFTLGSGTPVYRAAPSLAASPDVTDAPECGQVALVVPRS